MKPVISCVLTEPVGGHDHVHIWNRGGKAGVIVVVAGDGKEIADALVATLGCDRRVCDVCHDNPVAKFGDHCDVCDWMRTSEEQEE